MNCEDCKSKGCIDTACRTCWPKTNIPLNVIPDMTITVESDGLASINGEKLKAGVKYYPKYGDILESHQDLHATENIDVDSGQYHVIDRPKEDRNLFDGLMNGDNVEFKPVKYMAGQYLDSEGME